jgi:hypothetical protein
MSTAAVFLGIEKAFDITWHSGLLYKLSKLEFLTSLIKLSFTKIIKRLGGRRNVNAKDNASRAATRFGLVSYSFQYVYRLCPQTHGVHLAFFAEDTRMRQNARRVSLLENSNAV